MVRLSIPEEIATVSSICDEIGFGPAKPTLLKAAHHTSILIPTHKIVARVQSGEPIAAASGRATKEIAVTRYLADRGAPALDPIQQFAGPHVRASAVVTFWPYLDHWRPAHEADAPLAATSLATIHRSLRDFDGKLPPYTETLDRCWTALSNDSSCAALSVAERDLLKSEYRRLRYLIGTKAASWVPLHGDAHLGNFLINGDSSVWLDFEDACLGPREYDIANLPTGAWSNFADADPVLIAAYANLKSVCVAVWCSADIHRSEEIQEAADYHLSRIRGLAH